MRTLGTYFVLFATVLALAVTCVWIAGCDDAKPTQPEPPEPKACLAYFWDAEPPNMLYTYDPTTRQLDSTGFPYKPRKGITVSADGKRLYVAEFHSVKVVDAFSFRLITEFPCEPSPRAPAVAVSPDNRWVAICGDDLYVLRTSDHTIVFQDTGYVESGIFSADSRTFYCTNMEEWYLNAERWLYVLRDVGSENIVERRNISDESLLLAVPTPDENRLLTFVTSKFEVFDVAADSIVFSLDVWPGLGRIAVMPDGQRGFYGHAIHDQYGSSTLSVFDILSNEIDTVISTLTLVDTPSPPVFKIGSMAISPDGRWLVAMEDGLSRKLLLFDIEQMEFVDYRYLGGAKRLGNVSIRSGS